MRSERRHALQRHAARNASCVHRGAWGRVVDSRSERREITHIARSLGVTPVMDSDDGTELPDVHVGFTMTDGSGDHWLGRCQTNAIPVSRWAPTPGRQSVGGEGHVQCDYHERGIGSTCSEWHAELDASRHR